MERTVISFSTVKELEEATRTIGSGEPVCAMFIGPCGLGEAATLFHRLEVKVASSKGLWMVGEASREILRRSAEHYQELDLLELTLDLLELDLASSIPMKMKLFDDIRATANSVAATAHASKSNALGILGDVTIESQRLARVCRALGFGRHEVEVAHLMEEDLFWLMSDGAGAFVLATDGSYALEGCDDVGIADHGAETLPRSDGGEGKFEGAERLPRGDGVGKVTAGLVDGGEKVIADDGAERLPRGDGVGKATAGLVDGGEKVIADDGAERLPRGNGVVPEGLVDGGEEVIADDCAETLPRGDGVGKVPGGLNGGESIMIDGAERLPHGDGVREELAGGDDGKVQEHPGRDEVDGVGDGSEQPAWVEVKEETVIALVRFKIRNLRKAILDAKIRVVDP